MSGLKPEFQVIEESGENRTGDGRDAFRDPFPEDYAIGVVLRDARMRRKAGLEKVAGALRIRRDYLQAIEEGDADSLPGRAYAVGFVRSYAVWLGLDGEEAARRFKEETSGFSVRRPLPAPIGKPVANAPRSFVAGIVLALIAGAGVAIWYFLYFASGPPAPAGEAAVADPLPAAAALATDTPAAGAVAAGSAGAGADGTAAAPAATGAEGAAAVPADTARVVLTVVADSWIQIRNTEGVVLMTRLMRAGEEYPVDPSLEGLSLLVGDPSIVRFVVDGAVLPPLAAERAPGDGIPLDAARLIETVGGSD